MSQDMRQDKCNEMAMMRFALIAPAINNTYTQPSKRAYYHDVSERAVALPDGSTRYFNPNTLSCWESRYRRLGFEDSRKGHARIAVAHARLRLS